jgi:hypothetical protein
MVYSFIWMVALWIRSVAGFIPLSSVAPAEGVGLEVF